MKFLRSVALAAIVFCAGASAYAQANPSQFRTFSDCAVGKRVSINTGRTGTITRLDKAWSYCYVKFDDNGKEASYLYSLLYAASGTNSAGAANTALGYGQQLQEFKDCVVGRRVSTKDGRMGTITRLDPTWSYCNVRFDDGKESSMLFSLLNNAESGSQSVIPKLEAGFYECVAARATPVGSMRITGPDSYTFGSGAGKYHIETSGKIVFETGPLNGAFSKMVSGGRIGLNLNGDSFYATTCELNRNLR